MESSSLTEAIPDPLGPGPLARSLTRAGEFFTIVAYGLIGFGLVLFGGPSVLLFALAGGGGSGLASAAGITVAVFAILAAILGAVVLVPRRVFGADPSAARLPALWLAVGNLGAAALGGILSFDLLVLLGLVGTAIYLALFLVLNRPETTVS